MHQVKPEALVPKRRKGSTLLPVLNMVLAFALALLWWGSTRQAKTVHEENAQLRDRVADARRATAYAHVRTEQRLEDYDKRMARRLNALKAEFTVRYEKSQTRLGKARAALAQEVSHREREARMTELTALRSEMSELDQRLEARLKKAANAFRLDAEVFRSVQEKWDQSTFLVHSTFKWKSREDDGKTEIHEGTGWGTGFAVTSDGYIITNKHVIQPWKFDPELAAMTALGEVEVMEDSLSIAIWRSGSQCLNEDSEPDFGVGWNNGPRKNLRLAKTAPDSLISKSMDLAGSSLKYKLHALDNNDLVLLKAEGGPFKAVKLLSEGKQSSVRKLDRVMALGFPRGQRGLESSVAESSPSLGTVRKVENTIHITASIIPGNSGGPVFNLNGEVVGIATRIYSETLGICLQVDHARNLLKAAKAEIAATKKSEDTGGATLSALGDPR